MRFFRGIWEFIRSPLEKLMSWARWDTARTVGDMALSLELKAQNLQRQGIAEDFSQAERPLLPLLQALGITDPDRPLKALGIRAAEMLTTDMLSYSRDHDERAEQLARLGMLLDSMEAPRLADLLRRELSADLVEMSEEQLKTVGYWMIKSILEYLYKQPLGKNMPVASYLAGTLHKDVRKLVEAFGAENVISDPKTHPDVIPLSTMRLSTETRIQTKEDVEKVFGWLGRKHTPAGFWVGVSRADKVDFIVEEEEGHLYRGGVYLTFHKIASVLDKRRFRVLRFVYNALTFGDIPPKSAPEYQVDGVEYPLEHAGEAEQVVKMASKFASVNFGGFYCVQERGNVVTIDIF